MIHFTDALHWDASELLASISDNFFPTDNTDIFHLLANPLELRA